MIDFFHATLLGLVQGLTEFLPISSSAHLMLFQHFLGLKEPEVLLDVLLHVGTLISLAVYFYKPLLSLFDLRQKDSQKMWLLLVVATLATGVVGLPLKHTFEQEYANIPRMAVTLAMTGALLWLSGRCVAKRAMNRILDWKIALLMGVGQAIALEPGISRSATTICFALFLGVEREEAFRFSMLMSMPAVLLASLLKLKDGGSLAISVPAVGVGITIAFVAGLLTLWWLKRLVVSDHFARFGYYCWALAAAVLIFVR